MKITIIRHSFTRDVCRGTLTVTSPSLGEESMTLCTIESALPRNLERYIGHALPPGEYRCTCDESAISYKGTTLHLPWITLDEVPWFPNAQFVQTEIDSVPRRGEIFLGREFAELDFRVVNPDDDAMKLWARISDKAFKSGEDITLEVINADDITFEDTYKDKARLEAEERERMANREALINELLGN